MRENIITYLVVLPMIFLSGVLALLLAFVLGETAILELGLFSTAAIASIINWLIVFVVTLIRIAFVGSSEFVSFIDKKK